jgi:thioredoxin-like negative regulator of GroEL
MPYSFGPPFVDMPSAQLLGELALELGNAEVAAGAFAEQLKRSRQKAQVLLGLANAERARGNAEAADHAMAQYRQSQKVPDRTE